MGYTIKSQICVSIPYTFDTNLNKLTYLRKMNNL